MMDTVSYDVLRLLLGSFNEVRKEGIVRVSCTVLSPSHCAENFKDFLCRFYSRQYSIGREASLRRYIVCICITSSSRSRQNPKGTHFGGNFRILGESRFYLVFPMSPMSQPTNKNQITLFCEGTFVFTHVFREKAIYNEPCQPRDGISVTREAREQGLQASRS